MSSRTIDNPGVELNEIDRSGYEKVDNSLPNSPVSYVTGFADKGQNMTIEWIDSFATFADTFGVPTTEFEMYMYNAVAEVLNRGGSCIASRLPYDNNQQNKYNYVQYDINQLVKIIDDPYFQTIGDIHDRLAEVISNIPSMSGTEINTINQMANAIAQLTKEGLGDLTTINDLATRLANYIRDNITDKFALLYFNDSSLTSYIEISASSTYVGNDASSTDDDEYGATDDLSAFDSLLTSHKSVLQGTMRIYDITRAQYGTVQNYDCVSCDGTWTNECLGIVPVVVTPANAMYFQNILNNAVVNSSYEVDYTVFNSVSAYATQHYDGVYQDFSDVENHVSLPIASTTFNNMSVMDADSVSKTAAMRFPPINFYTPSSFDKENLKKIGIVVFKTFRDTSNSGKIGFQVLESFIGSFDRNAKDQTTHSSIFIDNVVNQNSQFIRVFSHIDQKLMAEASTFAMSRQPAVSMGFYKKDCAKDISFIQSIMDPLTALLDKAANPNHVPIDIVVDAGVSNIAQLAKIASIAQTNKLPSSIEDLSKLHTDMLPSIDSYNWPFNYAQHDISGWQAVVTKFDNFCKNTRKDCMFIADGLRPVCLDGNSKIVRTTAPENTVANAVIPMFKYIAHTIDSSYSAGYCNWFYQQNYGMSDYFWCPPSIKAMGVYIYCDTYFHPWSAPAGTTRGVIGDAVDVAFLPTDADAGIIYSNSWNYAMSYPIDGIVIEGHKTFQTQRTALDRVNVRRLMLSLESQVADVARAFVYEQNTEYTRQQFVDRITPILDAAVAGSGISEYAVKCDEELNTTQVIENNEMRCKIAVRPIKTVDYLVIDFIATNQSVSISEEIAR